MELSDVTEAGKRAIRDVAAGHKRSVKRGEKVVGFELHSNRD
jgi:hypothetical protein